MPRGKFASTNQKQYPDLGSDTSSVSNLCSFFIFNFFVQFSHLILLVFQLKGAIRSAEAGREDLEDRLAEMMNKLREARAQADEAVRTESFQNRDLVAHQTSGAVFLFVFGKKSQNKG